MAEELPDGWTEKRCWVADQGHGPSGRRSIMVSFLSPEETEQMSDQGWDQISTATPMISRVDLDPGFAPGAEQLPRLMGLFLVLEPLPRSNGMRALEHLRDVATEDR